MTGYGRGEYTEYNTTFTCEMRTVNHRYLDVNIKMSRQFSVIEDRLRALVSQGLSRGKVDVYITAENKGQTERTVKFDVLLAKSYIDGIRALSKELELEPIRHVDQLVRLPEVSSIEEVKRDPEDLWRCISNAVNQAIAGINGMRELEGKNLENDILMRLEKMENMVKAISEKAPIIVSDYRAKLSKRIADMIEDSKIDQDRLAMEVAIMADKCDFTEEVVRFKSHIHQFRKIISDGIGVGRKLDFLTQELNREINTIGSKAQDSDVTNMVIDIKSELEKVREQIQNIE